MDSFDPDFKYLGVDKKELLKEQTGTFDSKKNVFIPDDKEGFVKAEIVSTKGDDVTVELSSGLNKTVKKDDCYQMNPPKFEKTEDMANLSFLNEAAVLHNLRSRYTSGLIYTYSGLFCVVINPFRWLPIYTSQIILKYRGKRKSEMPPHLFAVADNAYSDMLQNRENQSVLITGESGAGKTENTKKVITFFAQVAAMGQKKDEKDGESKKGSLEDQIVQCNPVLEAYGNAKTIRNNNSSRFGKFIRIHFGPTGKIAGADIETYLLEKSRVTWQQGGERNYHIFFQILTNHYPEVVEKCLVDTDPSKYTNINQGELKVPGMDDSEEMAATDNGFDTLGFSPEEKLSIYKGTCSILHVGEMKFKQRGEQAEADGTAEVEKVAFLLGVNAVDLMKAILKPKVKVGGDYVFKGQTQQQCVFTTGALCKSTYDRLFNWLVKRINETLDTKKARQYFIGVLDIAGFEIFEFNGFEQLCINYTNECLQQFFNHHMFVLEQEEYKREQIDWEFIDFGMDLQKCIDLIERPMGILSVLEEQCMFPKATDKSLTEMLYDNCTKSDVFVKPKPGGKKTSEAHFELKHYAGVVGYNITGWLEKNKDPLAEAVIDVMRSSVDPLVKVWYPPLPPEDTSGKDKKKKGAAVQTISAMHRESLHKLMKNLHSTAPHFVRCLVPNSVKTAGIIDAHLVLHQLQCNGVLEGIRICRKGFPNRMVYADFKQRYCILASNAIPTSGEARMLSAKILEAIQLDSNDFKLGLTKVFFRAGVLANLEDMRDERLGKILSLFQAFVRGFLLRTKRKLLEDQRTALELIQRNVRKYLATKAWPWWKLYLLMQPLLASMRVEEEMRKQIEMLDKTIETLHKNKSLAEQLGKQNQDLKRMKDEFQTKLEESQIFVDEADEKISTLLTDKVDFEDRIRTLKERIKEEEENADRLGSLRKKMDEQAGMLKGDLNNLSASLQKAEQDKANKENQIRKIKSEMERRDEQLQKLGRDRKAMEDVSHKLQADLQAEEDKVNHLGHLKQKLEASLEELEDNLEREKRQRTELEKAKRKLEGDLKMTQETLDELDRIKRDWEDNLKRKDGEIVSLNSRIDEENNLIAQLQRKIKELQARIEELESELEAERQARSKIERQKADLTRELEELSDRVDEAGGATVAQHELQRKREVELVKLKRELEEQAVLHEQAITALRKKSNDAVNELTAHIDSLSKAKQKLDQERRTLEQESEHLHTDVEHLDRIKLQAEKVTKQLEMQVADAQGKLDEQVQQLNELTQQRNRLQQDNAELKHELENAEGQAAQVAKVKQTLQHQAEEAAKTLEEETRMRNKLQADLRNLQTELDRGREQVEEEHEARQTLGRQLAKAQAELDDLKRKYQSSAFGQTEDVEEVKKRLSAKLGESEMQLEAQLGKVAQLEKAKSRLQTELDDLLAEAERAQQSSSAMEKRQRQFDKIVSEWQMKCRDLQAELESAQRESRQYSAEVFKMKSAQDELGETIESLRRENKNLSDEIRDLTDQMSEGGRSAHEIEKARKRLDMEKEELQTALEEAEGALSQEEQKVMKAQLELQQIRQDIDRRLAEKDDEFEATRRNHQRAMDSLQASIEAESKNKQEASRMKKKLEQDIAELEMSLEEATRQGGELERMVKKYQTDIRELQTHFETEARQRDELREQAMVNERRAAILSSEIDELRNALEQVERARKNAEAELHETADRISELSAQANNFSQQKRKLEADLAAMQADLDEAVTSAKNADEKAKKAMADATRIAEELRQEQDNSQHLERLRKQVEMQLKELQVRLDEAEATGLKGGKRQLQRLEQRLRELEVELDAEQRRHQETLKEARKAERKVKELNFQCDEDKKNQERLQDMVDKLNQKLKIYKRQVEEAEELATVNLAKFRKVQADLEEAEARAEAAEADATRVKARARSSQSAARSVGPAGSADEAGRANPNARAVINMSALARLRTTPSVAMTSSMT